MSRSRRRRRPSPNSWAPWHRQMDGPATGWMASRRGGWPCRRMEIPRRGGWDLRGMDGVHAGWKVRRGADGVHAGRKAPPPSAMFLRQMQGSPIECGVSSSNARFCTVFRPFRDDFRAKTFQSARKRCSRRGDVATDRRGPPWCRRGWNRWAAAGRRCGARSGGTIAA